jgi:hypothetical protein
MTERQATYIPIRDIPAADVSKLVHVWSSYQAKDDMTQSEWEKVKSHIKDYLL